MDRNHAEIRDELRQRGWMVFDCAAMGKGFPDLLALKAGRAEFIEVKDGTKPPSKRALTEAEADLHASFKAAGVYVVLVEKPADLDQLERGMSSERDMR